MIDTVILSVVVLLRIFSNPLGNVFQKRLTGKGISPALINFTTYFLLSVLVLGSSLFINRQPVSKDFWLYSVLGGLAGALGNGFLVKALQLGELSVLGPLNSYKSIIAILFGIVLLGEIPNLWGALGIALIIFGSYFVLDTTTEKFSLALLKNRGIQYRVYALALTAIEAIFIKKVIIASTPMIAFAVWCFFGALFSFVLLMIYSDGIKKEIVKINFDIAGIFILLIICIGVMQLTTNYVFESMQVGYALSLFQLSIIISVILGHRLFNEANVVKKLLGSLIMIAGSVLIILLK